jgi:hypothetical protein
VGEFKELTSDQIWKNLIENFFEDFMNFFAGDISHVNGNIKVVLSIVS